MPEPKRQASRSKPERALWHHVHCSFCGKSAVRARFMVAGAKGGRICERCCVKSLGLFLRAGLKSALK